MDIVIPAVDAYLSSLVAESPLLKQVAIEGVELDLPSINSAVGRLLETLVLVTGAQRVLEIGTANGYSALWLAQSLPHNGRLISIELDPARAQIARGHFDDAGIGNRANVMVGNAARLVHKVSGPFDVIFNDGDKRQYLQLLDRLVTLLRPGGVLVTDNVLWNGEVVPGLVTSPQRPTDETEAIARYNKQLSADSRLVTSFLPVRDGISISVRKCSS